MPDVSLLAGGRTPRWALLALGVANVLWGASYAVIKLTVGRAPPLPLFAVCVSVAAALLLAIHLARPHRPRAPLGDVLRMAALGNVGITLPLVLLFQGLAWAPATDAALMIVGETIFMVALGLLWLRERAEPRRLAAAGLGIVGIALVVLSDAPSAPGGASASRLLGDLAMLTATLGDAVYAVAGASLARRYDPLTFLTWATVGALPAAVGTLVWAGWAGALPTIDGPALLGIAWIAGVQLVACFVLWFAALARVGAVIGGVSVILQPVAGIVVGSLVLGEALATEGAAGAALIVSALALAAANAHPSPEPRQTGAPT